MAFPQIMGVSEGVVTSDNATWNMTYPAGIRDRELLICVAGVDGDVNISSSPGWVSDADLGYLIAKRIGDPSLSGTGFSITLTGAEQGCWKVLRVAGWEGILGTNFSNTDVNGGACTVGGFQDATSANPETGGISPFWGGATKDTLWIAACAVDNGDVTFSVNPAGWTVVGSNQGSGGAAGKAFSVVKGEFVTATKFSGQWTISASTLYRAWQVVVKPGEPARPSISTVGGIGL